MSVESESLAGLSEAYRLLAAGFCQPDLAALREERVFERLAATLEARAPGAAGSARELAEAASSASQDDLLAEYARLFVGPGALVAAPYGSVYLDPGGIVMGPSTVRVAQAYRMAGVTPDPESEEPPDHISTELEFLHYLATLESQAAAGGNREEVERIRTWRTTFLSEWLAPWVSEFARRVREGTREAYYRHLAECLGAFVTHCATAVPPSLPEREPATRGDRR